MIETELFFVMEVEVPKYEVRKREWPDAFKRRSLPCFWRRQGLMRPWGLYRDGLIVGMYKTKEEAEAAMPPQEE